MHGSSPNGATGLDAWVPGPSRRWGLDDLDPGREEAQSEGKRRFFLASGRDEQGSLQGSFGTAEVRPLRWTHVAVVAEWPEGQLEGVLRLFVDGEEDVTVRLQGRPGNKGTGNKGAGWRVAGGRSQEDALAMQRAREARSLRVRAAGKGGSGATSGGVGQGNDWGDADDPESEFNAGPGHASGEAALGGSEAEGGGDYTFELGAPATVEFGARGRLRGAAMMLSGALAAHGAGHGIDSESKSSGEEVRVLGGAMSRGTVRREVAMGPPPAPPAWMVAMAARPPRASGLRVGPIANSENVGVVSI